MRVVLTEDLDLHSRGTLHFNSQTTGGGPFAKGTYNIPFDLVIPQSEYRHQQVYRLTHRLERSLVLGLNGTESSFVDQGFEQMTLNQENYFDSTRMVVSDINESTYLDSLPGNKSLSVGINMFTGDRRLSPCIDLNHGYGLVNNRINQPVTNFETDFRVNTVTDDPNRFFYITKNIRLENPATSVQVLLDSYVSTYNDVRVFYSVDGSDVVDENTFVHSLDMTTLTQPGNPIIAGNLEDLIPRSVKSISSLRIQEWNNSESISLQPHLNPFEPSELRSSEHQPTRQLFHSLETFV